MDYEQLLEKSGIGLPSGLSANDLAVVSRPDKSIHAIRFISTLCTHTKGKWAGVRFKLLPWQFSFLWELFGQCKEDGNRQYRTCYVEIAKKNGKSEIGAAVGLYMLCGDGEQGAEVYSAAADKEQAGLVFNVAAQMVRNNKVLSNRLKVVDSRKRIVDYKTNSFYAALSAEAFTKHGLNPSAILFDELHAQPNDELWNVLTSGTDYARSQQLVFVMTTAGVYDTKSIWWKQREKAIQVEKGVVQDDSLLPVLYIADKEDNPADEKVWLKANPSCGHIFTLDKIRDDFKRASQDPVEYQNFKRFRLNIPVNQINRWMPMDKWDECGKEKLKKGDLIGRIAYGGLDLSEKLDLTAFVLVFPPIEQKEKWKVLCHFFLPEETLMKRVERDKVPYNLWRDAGYLTATPGNVVDYEYIRRQISGFTENSSKIWPNSASKLYQLREVAYDPFGATAITTKLENDDGIQMVECRQGWKTMSPPMKDLLKMVVGGEIEHFGNPVLRWNADNLVVKPDAAGNVQPAKDKARERIDGMVALIMALGRALHEYGNTRSIYEDRGIVAL